MFLQGVPLGRSESNRLSQGQHSINGILTLKLELKLYSGCLGMVYATSYPRLYFLYTLGNGDLSMGRIASLLNIGLQGFMEEAWSLALC